LRRHASSDRQHRGAGGDRANPRSPQPREASLDPAHPSRAPPEGEFSP
jgi:hypothetical protein